MTFLYEGIRHLLQQWAQLSFMPDSLKYAFVANSLISIIIIGPVLGALGTMVVSKRLAFFSNAVGHAALTGVAIGILLGEPVTAPYTSLFAFCVLFAIYMNFTRNHTNMSQDTLIGIFLATSLAVGSSLLLFVTRTINTHILDTIMFGSILTVNDKDLNVLLIIAIVTIISGLIYFNRMVLVSFNTVLAEVRGIRSKLMDYLFILMITLVTVASVKIIGAVLVEALLLIPAAAAKNVSRSLKWFVIFSILFSTLSGITGIIVPIESDIPIPSGGAIIITSFLIFITTLIFSFSKFRFKSFINKISGFIGKPLENN